MAEMEGRGQHSTDQHARASLESKPLRSDPIPQQQITRGLDSGHAAICQSIDGFHVVHAWTMLVCDAAIRPLRISLCAGTENTASAEAERRVRTGGRPATDVSALLLCAVRSPVPLLSRASLWPRLGVRRRRVARFVCVTVGPVPSDADRLGLSHIRFGVSVDDRGAGTRGGRGKERCDRSVTRVDAVRPPHAHAQTRTGSGGTGRAAEHCDSMQRRNGRAVQSRGESLTPPRRAMRRLRF